MFIGKQKQKSIEQSKSNNQSKKRRKPQDRTKLTRCSQVQIRLTPEEVATLKAAAKESDMTLADFVMAGVSQKCRIVVPEAGALRADVIRVGNNLNQALRLAHSLRKEGQRVNVVSIEIAVTEAVMLIERINKWLTKWDVVLKYKTKNKKE